MTSDEGTSSSILIADDVTEVRQMLRILVESDPRFRVVGEAVNGVEAVEMTRKMRPDVLLLDISMARMDGLQALQSIRQETPDTKVVMVSGLSARHLKPMALSLGADGYLEKGFEPKELLAMLEELCGGT
jgi:YesN/AraC family two-component response regulator